MSESNSIHRFWSAQPVFQGTSDGGNTSNSNEPIQVIENPEKQVRQTPYLLPENYEWVVIDVKDDDQMQKFYQLLYENYVEDLDCTFRFNYSIQFLRWALLPPGYVKDWHIGIRLKDSGALVATVTGIPVTVRIYEKIVPMAEINFLCIHKKLRTRRLAPVLIKEVTRRINLMNVWQAVYTAGVSLPGSISECHYYHRSLNPKKLIEVGFSQLRRNASLSLTKKLYRVSPKPITPGHRRMEVGDVEAVKMLLNNYLKKFKLAIEFSSEEVLHWFVTREKVVYSYVVEDTQSKEITDFSSFYVLPSTVLNNKNYNSVDAAYMFYNVPNKTSLVDLVNDLLSCAKNLNLDVFNCLDLMENQKVFKEHKFGVGDGNLHYYLFNWTCPLIAPSDLGVVLF